MVDDEGITNGKFPIFDDMLAFIWCKMKISPCDTLLNVVKSYYKAADVVKSRDLLFSKLPDSSERRVKHRKTDEILRGIYDLMQALPTENPTVFVALDLNNIPYIELKNIDGVTLLTQQRVLKDDITAIKDDQEHMRSQLARICGMLENNQNSVRNTPPNIPAMISREQATEDASEDAQVPVAAALPAPVVEVNSNNENSQATTVNNRGGLSNNVLGASRGGHSAVSRHASRGRTTYAGMAAIGGRTVEARRVLRGSRSTENGMASREPNDGFEEEGSDEDGFITQVSRNQRRRNQKAAFTGRKTGTSLRSVPQVKKINLFVTRLEPNLSEDVLMSFAKDLINDDCSVEKLETRFPSYSSFKVTCDAKYKTAIMNPDEWPEGILIREYVGRRANAMGETLTRYNHASRYNRHA